MSFILFQIINRFLLIMVKNKIKNRMIRNSYTALNEISKSMHLDFYCDNTKCLEIINL